MSQYGATAYGCVAALDSSRLRQAPPSRGRVDVQGVAAASEPSQHLLPATDRGPQGRLAFGRQRARGGRGRQGSSTGPTPDAVDATRRLVSPDRPARRRHRGGQRLEHYNARRRRHKIRNLEAYAPRVVVSLHRLPEVARRPQRLHLGRVRPPRCIERSRDRSPLQFIRPSISLRIQHL